VNKKRVCLGREKDKLKSHILSPLSLGDIENTHFMKGVKSGRK